MNIRVKGLILFLIAFIPFYFTYLVIDSAFLIFIFMGIPSLMCLEASGLIFFKRSYFKGVVSWTKSLGVK